MLLGGLCLLLGGFATVGMPKGTTVACGMLLGGLCLLLGGFAAVGMLRWTVSLGQRMLLGGLLVGTEQGFLLSIHI